MIKNNEKVKKPTHVTSNFLIIKEKSNKNKIIIDKHFRIILKKKV